MIQLIGLNNNCSIEHREKLSITPGKIEAKTKKLLKICDECLIISTCNRTEIYFNAEDFSYKILEKIFEILDWDWDLKENVFHVADNKAVKHLMEVCSGFHSKILGEDQILGQIKEAYEKALTWKTIKHQLQRLFQFAITCGKEFRFKAELYKIPVSSASITIKESIKLGIKKFMIIGFGEVGKLCYKYIEDYNFEKLYIVVRNPNILNFSDERIKVIGFQDKYKYTEEVECIISCTSAPHVVLYENEIGDNKLTIFDLALPRDVDENIAKKPNVDLYDIDKISIKDDENKKKRREVMDKNRYIVESYVKEFLEWQKFRELSSHIKQMSDCGEYIYKKRYDTFKRKKNTKDNEELVRTLLKSTSDFYIHRAIDVLKEEMLKGRAEECLDILERIFIPEN